MELGAGWESEGCALRVWALLPVVSPGRLGGAAHTQVFQWQVLTVTAGFSDEDVCSWEKCREVCCEAGLCRHTLPSEKCAVLGAVLCPQARLLSEAQGQQIRTQARSQCLQTRSLPRPRSLRVSPGTWPPCGWHSQGACWVGGAIQWPALTPWAAWMRPRWPPSGPLSPAVSAVVSVLLLVWELRWLLHGSALGLVRLGPHALAARGRWFSRQVSMVSGAPLCAGAGSATRPVLGETSWSGCPCGRLAEPAS